MKLLEKIDWNTLNVYINNNLIIANKHPIYDIWILNYLPKVQFNKLWDDYTLSCRGLIIDVDGNILARPFQKFKNIEEHNPSEIDMTKNYEIFEKMDGSLIILFYYKKEMKWMVASRGSFISEQCIEAGKMLKPNILEKLDVNYTYLFEIIYPENRIVVNYGNMRDLILLSVINTNNGTELSYDSMLKKYSNIFTVVKKINHGKINNLYDLKRLEESNKEGFVVKFSDGFRVKVKFNEYIKLHGILSNVSNVTIWEYLKNDYDFDLLIDQIPDEFNDWIKKTIKKIQIEYNEIERNALKEFIRIYHINNIGSDVNYGDTENRKRFAIEAIKTKYASILFRLYNKKTYDYIIWSMVKPKQLKTFKDNINVRCKRIGRHRNQKTNRQKDEILTLKPTRN